MTDKTKTVYGPHNPHPLSQLGTELVWEGKYDEFGNKREVQVLGQAMPLQRIEMIDEPRSRAEAQGSLFDETTAHTDGFRNKLIWGDNKLILSALCEEFSGSFKLIYIDPPFDVGDDFSLNVQIGENSREEVSKEPSIIEQVAYRDIWGKGSSSYLHMMYERLTLIKELLSDDGSLYLHCDWRVNSYLRSIIDEVFGNQKFRSGICWKSSPGHSDQSYFGEKQNTILFATKGDKATWNQLYQVYDPEYLDQHYQKRDEDGRRFEDDNLTAYGLKGGGYEYEWNGVTKLWRCPIETMRKHEKAKRIYYTKNGVARYKRYLDEMPGSPISDLWTDIPRINSQANEKNGYPTQKPEALLERIIKASSDEGDLIGDFFCGSGTTLAVAEKLKRKWVGCDLGRFAVHTARKRLIGIQRDQNDLGLPYRSFDIYNLGRYERQWWQNEALEGADEEHLSVVLKFFRAEQITGAPSPLIHGRKGTAFVHVDGIDSIFTRDEVSDVAQAVKAAGGKQVHCLAWDFEMDLRQAVTAVEAELGINIRLHRIPREIMEKNRTEVPPFFEVALLEADPVVKSGKDGKTAEIKLSNFVPSLTEVPSKELEALQERAIESGFDFIDFWAIDFDWSPGQPFNHHWQDYRTRKDRALKTVSDAEFKYDKPGKHTACVKVVDVFGCDTSITVEIEV